MILWTVMSILTLGAANQVKAQVAKDDVALVESIWGIEKRAIISDYMKFTPEELEKFVPVYDAYSDEMKKLGEERIQIISEYANNYSTLTNEKADQLMVRALANNENIDKLMKKYYAKIKKEISPIRAAQFMQLEWYLQTAIRSEIQSEIPFIGELDRLDESND